VGVTRHRLPALALVVATLVAVVALVAHGRPLAARAGHGGLPTSFWDYLVTSAIIVVVLGWLVLFVMALQSKRGPVESRRPSALHQLRTVLGLAVFGVLFAFFWRHVTFGPRQPPAPVSGGGAGSGGEGTATSASHVVWIEVAVVAGLLLLVGAIAAPSRLRKSAKRRDFREAPGAVAAALDESLEDLRSDQDLRRAIVAAYARMERALGFAGLPRRPAEAPLEYVERALLALHTSGPSVRSLTDLFEWAKFSQHEPQPSMRDEAVDALVAVRDELREPAEVAA
jgi:hypothetical protein